MIRALVMYYDGKEVPDNAVDLIVNNLVQAGVAEGNRVTVSMLGPEDISKIIVPAIKPAIVSRLKPDRIVQAACKYIKERFKLVMSDTVSFAISLASAVADAKKDGVKGNMLFEAMQTISEAGSECCKHGLTADVINVIKQINENL